MSHKHIQMGLFPLLQSLCREIKQRRRGVASILRLCQHLLDDRDTCNLNADHQPMQLIIVNLERRWEAIVMQAVQWQTRLQKKMGKESVSDAVIIFGTRSNCFRVWKMCSCYKWFHSLKEKLPAKWDSVWHNRDILAWTKCVWSYLIVFLRSHMTIRLTLTKRNHNFFNHSPMILIYHTVPVGGQSIWNTVYTVQVVQRNTVYCLPCLSLTWYESALLICTPLHCCSCLELLLK